MNWQHPRLWTKGGEILSPTSDGVSGLSRRNSIIVTKIKFTCTFNRSSTGQLPTSATVLRVQVKPEPMVFSVFHQTTSDATSLIAALTIKDFPPHDPSQTLRSLIFYILLVFAAESPFANCSESHAFGHVSPFKMRSAQ